MSKGLVRKYYSGYGRKEWRRLIKDRYHQLEFDTTMYFLKKYLPKKGLILDAGGGPGRYTIALAKLGYEVVLFDLTPELLVVAKKEIKKAGVEDRVKQIVRGSIDDISMFKDNTFDAVICLGGPLSHLIDKKQREAAASELVRVAKKNAFIFVSVIGRLAVLITELIRFPEEIENKKVFSLVRDEGTYRGGYGFTACHFFLPEELKELFEKRKTRVLEMVGMEGLSSGQESKTKKLFKKYPKGWKVWWETHLKTCVHPSVAGASEHFMIIVKK